MFNEDEVVEKIKTFLKSRLNGKIAVLGVSSGIDSSLVLKLLSVSINTNKIKAIFMPDRFTRESDYDDIKALEDNTGIRIETINIEPVFSSFISILGHTDKKIEGNLRSRIRATILYYFANQYNGLVIGTTNRTEYLLGYYTKFGDGACDIEPIEFLYKTDVRKISKYLGIPDSIINKKPSAGLWENQYDEDELSMPYHRVDQILIDIFDKNIRKDTDDYKKIIGIYNNSEHKRRMPETLN
ncbi:MULTISPECIES: NAD+ synthase [unclassified Acidiplasma]|uniref:NAD+ synthase n=1 Tax=unclassified Acidiplasma TaxID=2641301 RepID=UPI0005DE2EEF|nr:MULTISPECIES: NAD+ synthase [unclassified Acidiplasma]KJE49333.1 NAD synthetase [Acidiplasma sp. MBA-1]WMT54727.1 MAG: NAD+ synthase [Acidiplasma sp.]